MSRSCIPLAIVAALLGTLLSTSAADAQQANSAEDAPCPTSGCPVYRPPQNLPVYNAPQARTPQPAQPTYRPNTSYNNAQTAIGLLGTVLSLSSPDTPTPAPATSDCEAEFQAAYQKGVDAYNKREYHDAAADFTEALTCHDDSNARQNLADTLYQMNLADNAARNAIPDPFASSPSTDSGDNPFETSLSPADWTTHLGEEFPAPLCPTMGQLYARFKQEHPNADDDEAIKGAFGALLLTNERPGCPDYDPKPHYPEDAYRQGNQFKRAHQQALQSQPTQIP